MKARIVTFVRAHNYGAVLQCYALAEALSNLNIECDVLDYLPETFENIYYGKKTKKNIKGYIYEILKYLRIIKIADNQHGYKKSSSLYKSKLQERIKSFDNFINTKIPLTSKTIRFEKDIQAEFSDCDCYITGSDQVWNYKLCGFDSIFFLSFPDAEIKKKYSYAASFGMSELPSDMRMEYYNRLVGFDSISVREQSGKEIIDELVNTKAVVSCDPTLLLTIDEWNKIVDDNCEKEPYIFIYYVGRLNKLQETAKELSERTGYKVISVPCNVEPYVLCGAYDEPYGFDIRTSCSPGEFLSLVKNAEYVLTNSFHGTVFSVLFHKQFLTAINLGKESKSFRIIDLLDTLQIKDRDIMEDDDVDKPINWNKVEQNLYEFRNEGLKYIKKIVERTEGENNGV